MKCPLFGRADEIRHVAIKEFNTLVNTFLAVRVTQTGSLAAEWLRDLNVKQMPPRFSGPTYSCVRCGAVAKVMRLSATDLRYAGYEAWKPGAYVNWCGHAQEFIPWLNAEGLFSLVPIVGEASSRSFAVPSYFAGAWRLR